MAIMEKELVFVFLAFRVVFLMFSNCRAHTRSIVDLLESSVGARHFPIVVVYSWIQCILQMLC